MQLHEEIRSNCISYRDFELQLKDVLKKAGYKPPYLVKERGTEEREVIHPTIPEKDLAIAINADLKLFT